MAASGTLQLLQTFSPRTFQTTKIYQNLGQRRFQLQIYSSGIERITKQIMGCFFYVTVWILLFWFSRKGKINPQEQNLFHTHDYTFMHVYIRSWHRLDWTKGKKTFRNSNKSGRTKKKEVKFQKGKFLLPKMEWKVLWMLLRCGVHSALMMLTRDRIRWITDLRHTSSTVKSFVFDDKWEMLDINKIQMEFTRQIAV